MTRLAFRALDCSVCGEFSISIVVEPRRLVEEIPVHKFLRSRRFGVGFGRLGAAFDGSGKHIDHHRAKPFFFSVLPGAFCHGQLVVFAAGTPFSISISSGRPIHTLMITSLQQVAARAGAR